MAVVGRHGCRGIPFLVQIEQRHQAQQGKYDTGQRTKTRQHADTCAYAGNSR